MVALYVVSSERAAGKTAICAGVGRQLLNARKKTGFLKPVIGEGGGSDGDAAFMKQVLDLPEAVDSLCPRVSDAMALAARLKEACAGVSQDKDVVIIEGVLGQKPDDELSRASYEAAQALNARVVIVEGYSNQSTGFIDTYKGFGGNLIGVLLNKVPASRLKRVSGEASARFGIAGIKLLGVLPEDRALFTMTVGELAGGIQGKILNNAGGSAELVENLMLGAMCVDSGLEYFGRKAGKGVVVGSDRPDMQLAALETPTRCLVISGSAEPPVYSVLHKAENKGIPIVLTENDTGSVIASIEDTLGKARFNQDKKLPRLTEIIKQHVDLRAIFGGLGLAG